MEKAPWASAWKILAIRKEARLGALPETILPFLFGTAFFFAAILGAAAFGKRK